MVEDGLSVLRFYYCNVNTHNLHFTCNPKEYYVFPLFHVVYS